MRADYIKTIVNKIDKLPYKAILFDGVWGIGKSYAVNEALEENTDVCRISMFGISSASQIYHEVLFQLALKNSIGGKIGEIANNIVEGLSVVWEKAGQAKEIIRSIAKERELFLLLSKGFNSWHIVVIDDIERMSDMVSLEEVLGIVEELKQCSFVKVILIAHTGQIEGNNRTIFDKYKEKVIDRTYHITETPEKVNWSELGIHAGFIEEFLKIHKVNNLRTLEKAQHFFDDVKLFCTDISNERFIDVIRIICFAIVVESTDELYYRDPEQYEKGTREYSFAEIHNELECRITNYLSNVIGSRSLVSRILQYYQNETLISAEIINTEYKLFLEAGKKPNFYKTDEEINVVLPNIKNKMKEADNLSELNRFADEYMVWSEIIGEDSFEFVQEYRHKLHEMLLKLIQEEQEDILSYGVSLFDMSSEKIVSIYSEEIKKMKNELIEIYIKNMQGKAEKIVFDYSYKLRVHFESSYFRDTIMNFTDCLYDIKFFPVGEISETRYHTCYNIMYILYKADKNRFKEFCDKIKESCDHMSAHRVEVLEKEIEKE